MVTNQKNGEPEIHTSPLYAEIDRLKAELAEARAELAAAYAAIRALTTTIPAALDPPAGGSHE